MRIMGSYVTSQRGNTVSGIAPLTTTFSEGCNGTINNTGQKAICSDQHIWKAIRPCFLFYMGKIITRYPYSLPLIE